MQPDKNGLESEQSEQNKFLQAILNEETNRGDRQYWAHNSWLRGSARSTLRDPERIQAGRHANCVSDLQLPSDRRLAEHASSPVHLGFLVA